MAVRGVGRRRLHFTGINQFLRTKRTKKEDEKHLLATPSCHDR